MLAALAAGVVLAACSGTPRFGAPRSATRQGRQVNQLFSGFVIVGLCVFAIVWCLVLWSVFRYRRRRDLPSAVPKQVRGNVPLELFLTAVSLAIVAVLFAFTVRVQTDEDRLRPHPEVRIEVTGFQWQWRFEYVRGGVTITGAPGHDPELVLPVDTRVRFDLRSADVIHSFYVPGFLFKRDVIPRVPNEVEVTPVRTGRYDGLCAEYCGLDHARMGFAVKVVDQDAYRAWLAHGTGRKSA